MRQLVKRRLFLMSMALVTGASHSAYAKGGSKTGGDDLVYANSWLAGTHFTALPGEEMREETKPSMLFGKLKNLLDGLSYSPEVAPLGFGTKGWRLEMLPPDARSDLASDFRLEKAKRFGVALRVPF
jgi:hypothetical protein